MSAIKNDLVKTLRFASDRLKVITARECSYRVELVLSEQETLVLVDGGTHPVIRFAEPLGTSKGIALLLDVLGVSWSWND